MRMVGFLFFSGLSSDPKRRQVSSQSIFIYLSSCLYSYYYIFTYLVVYLAWLFGVMSEISQQGDHSCL